MTKTWRHFSQILTLEKAAAKDGRGLKPDDLSVIKDGSIVFNDQEIVWVGLDDELPKKYLENSDIKDFSGHVLTPELVDGHTHLIFGGDRSKEYSMRLNGADYQAIANSGGGILHTSKATNEKSTELLFKESCEKINRIHSYGVGTIEIKSGYALNFEKEYEISHIIDRLKKHFAPKIQIINTFMAAHAVPNGFSSSRDYLDQVVIPLMKKLSEEKIIDAVDIFHEVNYFSYEDTEHLFKEAKKLNLPFKSHADEFQDNKGALLAATMGALSTDHLLCTSSDGIKALANSKTVATLLPGTGFFLGKPQSKAREFLDANVKVAMATDYNPGSCHCDNLLLVAALAAPNLKFNQTELWCAITLNSSHALGLFDQGSLQVGLKPRFSLFKCDNIDQITYSWGQNMAINFDTN